jgi:hypothetical protein
MTVGEFKQWLEDNKVPDSAYMSTRVYYDTGKDAFFLQSITNEKVSFVENVVVVD